MFDGMAQRKTLLIVDDDADLRGAVAEQLQAEGFTALEAPTARENCTEPAAAPSILGPAADWTVTFTTPMTVPMNSAFSPISIEI